MKPASLLLLLAVAAANIHNYKGDDAWPPLQQALADYPKSVAARIWGRVATTPRPRRGYSAELLRRGRRFRAAGETPRSSSRAAISSSSAPASSAGGRKMTMCRILPRCVRAAW
mmetsp:Transcript_6781/g.21348  ORF Transcript_6781/g.21348 Transcript_6781/m.21348 type:complete len:114 (-) Transcript_6781:631-972(-)